MSAEKPTVRTYAWRATLIGVLAAGILVFGFSSGRAWFGSPRRLPPPQPHRPRLPLGFDPLPGSNLLSSYDVVFNGEKSRFGHFRSRLAAEEVAEQFEERYGSTTPRLDVTAPGAHKEAMEGTMVRVVAPGYAIAGARESDGTIVGLIVFNDPNLRGSTYFVGRGSQARKGWREGDVPGEDVSGVRPLRSRRVLCVDGLGGIPSRLLLYEGWGAISDTVDHFASEMPKAGWARNAEVEKVIQKRLPGCFLSFLRGTRRTMVYIEREDITEKVRTAVIYSIKDWLPPDLGL